MPIHCPSCQGTNITKSKRKGLFESIVFKLIDIRPYRCLSCDLRFFHRALTHRHAASHAAIAGIRSNIRGVLTVLAGTEGSGETPLAGSSIASNQAALEKR